MYQGTNEEFRNWKNSVTHYRMFEGLKQHFEEVPKILCDKMLSYK